MELGRTFERAHTYDNGCAVPLEIPRWADPKNLISPRSVAVQNSSSITLCSQKFPHHSGALLRAGCSNLNIFKWVER